MIIKNELNEAQQAALKLDGHILVIAGAGSGKTRVLTYRIAKMVNDYSVSPYEILAITFTNKASTEMKSRLELITDCAHQMWISTIHSMCAKILRIEADRIGLTSSFSIYNEDDSTRTIKRILKTLNWQEEEHLLKNSLWQISSAKTQGIDAKRFLEYFDYIREADKISKIYYEYERELKNSNSLDFDDLLLETFKLLQSCDEVRIKYATRFRYISVDEFQDTNKIQYDILKLLQSVHNNLFVVGDDDQSIYGWRGAEIKNILDFDKDFPDATVFKLEQNYRSTKKIIKASNEIICKNTSRKNKELWTENSDGVKVETYCAFNENNEAVYVVEQILALINFSGLSYSDFAILMRLNALSRSFEQECIKYGIPVKVFGGFKFFERKEIKDLISYLSLVINPKNNEAFIRIINAPKRGIGDATVNKLSRYASENGMSIFSALDDENALINFNLGTKSKLVSFKNLILSFIEYQKTHTLVEFVENLLDQTLYRKSLLESDDDSEKVIYVDEFVQAVKDFSSQNIDATISDFVESVTLSSDKESQISDTSDYVSISTIHAAKGLEFKVVFVVGLDDGLFPSSRSSIDLNDLEEERRLMYVAMTRAKERLLLTRTKSRFLYGQTRMMTPSTFFKEVENSNKTKTYEEELNEQIDLAPPKSSVKIDLEKYQPGAKVVHSVFGNGVVLTRNGDNADISFKGIGIKTLALKFAPLELKDE